MSWEWLDNTDCKAEKWTSVPQLDNIRMEEEYQLHLAGTRMSQQVFHCFGNGWAAIISYLEMETSCGSGRCWGRHGDDICDDHMTFKLRRS